MAMTLFSGCEFNGAVNMRSGRRLWSKGDFTVDRQEGASSFVTCAMAEAGRAFSRLHERATWDAEGVAAGRHGMPVTRDLLAARVQGTRGPNRF
jgi:hypothetical protein